MNFKQKKNSSNAKQAALFSTRKKEDTKMSYVNSRTKRKSVIICKETKRKKIQFGRQKKKP